MHTYVKHPEGPGVYLYTVGYLAFDNETGKTRFFPLKDFSTEKEAAAYVNWLNGGSADWRN